MTLNEDHNWKFAQCFGDKGDSDDITEGSFSIFALQRHANFIYNSTTTFVFTFSLLHWQPTLSRQSNSTIRVTIWQQETRVDVLFYLKEVTV